MSTTTYLVYRLYAADDSLLYIGMTSNWTRRRARHAAEKSWFPEVARIEMESCATRQEAQTREATLIRQHRPRYNDAHIPRDWIRTSVNVPPARMRVLRRLAADLGLYVSRGPAAGQAGNVAEMLNRLVDVYERNPGGTRALLRALLDIAPPADGD